MILTPHGHKLVTSDSGSGSNYLRHLAIENACVADSYTTSRSNQSTVNLSISTLDKSSINQPINRNISKIIQRNKYRRCSEQINNNTTIKVRPYKSMPSILRADEEKITEFKVNTTISKNKSQSKPIQINALPKLLSPNDIYKICHIQAVIRGFLTRIKIEKEESKLFLKKQVVDCQIDYELTQQLQYYDYINPQLKINEYIKVSKNIINLRNKYIAKNQFIWSEKVRNVFIVLFKFVQKCDCGTFIRKKDLHYFLINVLNLPIQDSKIDKIIDVEIVKSKNGMYSFKSVVSWYIMKRQDAFSVIGYFQRYRRNKKQNLSSFCFDEEYISPFFNHNLRTTIEKQMYLGFKPNYDFLLFCHRCGIHFTKCNKYIKHVLKTHSFGN